MSEQDVFRSDGVIRTIVLGLRKRLGGLVVIIILAAIIGAWLGYEYLYKADLALLTSSETRRAEKTTELLMLSEYIRKILQLGMPPNDVLSITAGDIGGFDKDRIASPYGKELENYRRLKEDLAVFYKRHSGYFSNPLYSNLKNRIDGEIFRGDSIFTLMVQYMEAPGNYKSREKSALYQEGILRMEEMDKGIDLVVEYAGERLGELKSSYDMEYASDLALQVSLSKKFKLLAYVWVITFGLAGLVFLFYFGRKERYTMRISESEEKYRELVESSSDAIFISDAGNGIIIDVNKSAEKITGYSREEMIGMRNTEFHFFGLSDDYRAVFKDASAGKISSYYDFQFKRKDGTVFFVDGNFSLAEVGGRKILQVIFRDMTDRKLMEKKFEEDARFLQDIIDAVPSPIFYKDAAGLYLGCNRTFEKWFGINRQDIIGKSVFDLSPFELAQKYYEKDKELFDNPDKPQVYETSVQPRNNLLRRVEFNKSVFFDATGNIGGLVGAVHDITDRKKTEEQILIFRRFTEASGQGFGMIGLDRKIAYLNPTLAGMIGLDEPQSAYGADFLEYYPEGERDRVVNAVIPLVLGTGQWIGETELLGREGKTIPVIGNFFIVRDEGGETLHIAVVYTDISERKKMEDEQHVLLRQSVAALKNGEEQKKKAEVANRLKSEFLANMSHELRTPLSSVLGYSRLSGQLHSAISDNMQKLSDAIQNVSDPEGASGVSGKGGAKKAEKKRAGKKEVDLGAALSNIYGMFQELMLKNIESANFIGIINQQGEKLLSLINDLLDLSQIEAGFLNLRIQPVSARLLLASVVATMSSVAKEKGIKLESNRESLDENDILFYADKKRLEQILQNLVDNGIKYSDTGTVSIDMNSTNGNVVMVVRDEGIGISKDENGAIFEQFRQLDGSLTRSRGGIGLGLALVSRLVEAMEGVVAVESEIGKGSTFTVTLPYRKVIPDSDEKEKDEELTRLSGKKFLVIDDDINNRNLLSEMLSENRLVLASNGREGLEVLKREGLFDAVLLDMHMPVMSGSEMLEHLPDGFSTPIIIVSADVLKEKEGQVKKLAEEKNLTMEYVYKPFSSMDLISAFSKHGIV
jgi:PAS domain S-box-containing protein